MHPALKVISIAIMCLTPLMFTNSGEISKEVIVEESEIVESVVETYEHYIKIDQSNLKLDHEVVQYKIIFHENDTVDFFGRVRYRIVEVEPVAYFLCLTDGKKNLVNITLFIHEPIGGKLRYKLLNVGQTNDVNTIESVSKGDVWYLTIAVFNSKKEEITALFQTSTYCMELVELERHSEIEYLSAWQRDFDGLYLGVKLLLLPFGISIARNVGKIIITTRGTIVKFLSACHLICRLNVIAPDGAHGGYMSEKGMARYMYLGNQTGAWSFETSGIGFPFKHIIMLFYIDIDPHIRLEE